MVLVRFNANLLLCRDKGGLGQDGSCWHSPPGAEPGAGTYEELLLAFGVTLQDGIEQLSRLAGQRAQSAFNSHRVCLKSPQSVSQLTEHLPSNSANCACPIQAPASPWDCHCHCFPHQSCPPTLCSLQSLTICFLFLHSLQYSLCSLHTCQEQGKVRTTQPGATLRSLCKPKAGKCLVPRTSYIWAMARGVSGSRSDPKPLQGHELCLVTAQERDRSNC